MIDLRHGDCLQLLKGVPQGNVCIVTDPPFNIGYHYNTYADKMPEEQL